MSRPLRIAFVLLIVSIAAATSVLADPLWNIQPRLSVVSAPTPMDLVARFWRVVAGPWNKNGSEMDHYGLRTKSGGMIGVDGNTLQTPVPRKTDNGPEADPNG
jgi:hypothetical protein